MYLPSYVPVCDVTSGMLIKCRSYSTGISIPGIVLRVLERTGYAVVVDVEGEEFMTSTLGVELWE